MCIIIAAPSFQVVSETCFFIPSFVYKEREENPVQVLLAALREAQNINAIRAFFV